MTTDKSPLLHRAIVDLIRVYQFRDRESVFCYDVSVTQSHLLERLQSLGPLTMTELAGALYLEKSTMSRIVDGLEGKGYVRRSKDPGDGRIVRISITTRGERLSKKIEADLIRQEENVFSEFTAKEVETIARGIQQLADASSKRVKVKGGVCRWIP